MLTGRLTLAAAALLACAGASPAAAEFKPTRPIEVVVHGGPGSGNDLFGRAVVAAVEAEKLATVRFQIANKPGGGSTTAANYLMSKDGDAHTIGVFTNIWLTDPLVQAEAKARLHDMTPIARILVEPALVVVRGDSELKTLRDFIDAAKAKPGQMKQSGGSITARENIIRQMLMNNTGARWTFISFPSGGERLAALLGGHVDVMILDPAEAGEQVRTGKLRVIAQVSEQRLDAFMDVPTLKEAGFDIPNVPQTRGHRRPARHAGRRGRLFRRSLAEGHGDARLAEVSAGQSVRGCLRRSRGDPRLSGALRRADPRPSERDRRQGCTLVA